MQQLCKDTGTQQWSLLRVIEAHPVYRGGGSASVHFDHSGARVATSMFDSDADSAWKVWDVATG